MASMKKSLFLIVVVLSLLSLSAFAAPIVELSAPKIQEPKVIQDDNTAPKDVTNIQTPQKAQTSKPSSKKHLKIRHHHKRPPQIKVDYDKVSKLIEYNYFDDADKILQDAIIRNSKDAKARALLVISLAKQCKLDPAQNELNDLLKQYPNDSNLHYAQGVIYYQRTTSSNMFYRNNSQKLINDAMNEFKKAIDLDKNNCRAYNAAGVISLTLNKPNDAKNYFQKALAADKTYSMAIDNLGTMDFANGKLDDAQKKFKQSLTYNTQNTTAMYHLAQIAIQKQDYSTALFYLNNALAINLNSPAIYNLMGKAYVAQGNEAAAIDSFKKSIMVKPEFVLSYLDLADVYEKRGDNEFAIERLKTALSIEPDYYDAKLKMADISLESGKYKQAATVYSELVGIDGYNDSALKGLASAYYGQAQVSSNKALLGSNKDLFNAMDNINKAIAANSQDLELHLAKLKLAKITNQPEQTKIELSKIIASPDCNLVNMVVKGEAYLTLNDYKNAEKAFDSAVKLSNNSEDDLYLAEIFIYHKQYDCAEKVLQKILKTDAQNQEVLSDIEYIRKSKKCADNYFASAKFFLKSRNSSTAMEYLSRSLALNPNNPPAHLLLAKLCEKQKNYPEAIANYKAYLGLGLNPSDAKKIKRKIQSLDNRL